MKQFFVINKYSLIIIFLLIGLSSVAQGGSPPPPDAPDGGGGPGTVNDIVPINMYWFMLLFAGAYYGVKKLR